VRPRWNTGVLRSIRQNDEQDLARVVELVMLKSEHSCAAPPRDQAKASAKARPQWLKSSNPGAASLQKNLHVASCTGFSPNIHRFSTISAREFVVAIRGSWLDGLEAANYP
jgi:hypothetical protein